MNKAQIEEANMKLAQSWCDGLSYHDIDLVDILEYETMRVLGAVWKKYLDEQPTPEETEAVNG